MLRTFVGRRKRRRLPQRFVFRSIRNFLREEVFVEEKKSYENWAREHAEAMIKIGFQDPTALRELLICTTISTYKRWKCLF